MQTNPGAESDEPLDLGRDGEAQFERLRASIEYGQGFELFFCGFDTWPSLAEVKRRLTVMPPPGHVFEALSLEEPGSLRTMADRLAAIPPAQSGRKIVFTASTGRVEDLKAEWAIGLRRFNERRNITIRDCPNVIVIAGPSWLPWLAHDHAPDLWSVRTAVFTFPRPPAGRDIFHAPEREQWGFGFPMAHELQPPAYYEELAAALEAGRNPGEQETRGRLLLSACAAWQLKGDYDRALAAAETAREIFADAHEELMVAVTMGRIADILQQRGETDEALRIYRDELLPMFEQLGDVRSRAITTGKIADILQQRGDTHRALRVHREELLPEFERLGDVRSRAVTMGKIADILQLRGETDEALRIRQEEELPVYERLGDVRSRAVTMGKIADILQDRGETEEALRIRQEEELPVYERLGDVRSRAVTMGRIADILQQRGDTEEALRIYREELLPAFERLGDVRSRAVTMGKIADILQDRGETEEALRIYREELLPAFERLGDVRSRAVTMGKIADILQQRGDTEEALRIRQEEELPVYERLGDVRERAVTMGKIADILQQRGDTEEALRIRQEEELPVYERLGDVRERAVTMGKIADILQQRGDTEEALRIRQEEELPVYERLGDVRSRAVTMGQIADILQQRGDTEEALRIWTEECLPALESIGDIDVIANIRFACASARLDRGGWEQGEAQTIYDELAESFALCRRLQSMAGIATVGRLLGEVLAAVDQVDDALTVLDQSAAAFEKLNRVDEAAEVRVIQSQIRDGNG